MKKGNTFISLGQLLLFKAFFIYMNKDAFYFPHFSNARNDRKLRRVRKELGIEGYGIYFMVLETLRDQEGFIYPMEDLDLLAEEFGTSEQKIRTVVCNYQLFQVNEDQQFFSIKFIEYLEPYLITKERKRISGIKGNLIRHKHITKEHADEMSDDEILALNDEIKSFSRSATAMQSLNDRSGSQKKVKESKTKENKLNKTKEPKVFAFEVNDCYDSVFDLFPESTRPKTDKEVMSWKDEIRKLIEIDGFNKETIYEVCKRTRVDDFWSTNFLSINKLRKKNNEGIKYINVFIEKFKNQNNGRTKQDNKDEQYAFFNQLHEGGYYKED